MSKRKLSGGITRREMLKGTGLILGGLAIPGALESCLTSSTSSTSSGSIKIGFVSPLTGPAAGFGEPDPYVLGLARRSVRRAASRSAARTTPSRSFDKDGQSTPSVGAQVAQRPDPEPEAST